MHRTARTSLTAVAIATLLATAACGATKSGGDASNHHRSGKKSGRIALLLPENVTARYEAADKPYFEQELKKICPSCTLDYQNAQSHEDDQLNQAEAAITNGADVLVIDALNGDVGTTIVEKAKAAGIPVESYERLIPNADIDAYISFDNEKVGELQGQALVAKLKADGTLHKGKIIMLNGDLKGDANARDFRRGALKVFKKNHVEIAKQYDTVWEPDTAQNQMDGAITAVGSDRIVGVYAANDTVAGAAITSMTNGGMDPKSIPTTGQDAEVPGIQRIIAGTQYMTVFKPIKAEGAKGADIAYALLQGKKAPGNDKVNNGKVTAPAYLLPTYAVTNNGQHGTRAVKTIFKDWWFTPAQICKGELAAPCQQLGLG